MENTFNNRKTEAYLCSCSSIITNVNKEFLDFTGFPEDEVVGKSLIEIGAILNLNSQILLESITESFFGYIFTKELNAREINISVCNDNKTNEKKYIFVEKANSRLDDKLTFVEQTFIENISGAAVYSVPNLILLKSNKKYLDLMNYPFNKGETSTGRHIGEIIHGFIGSEDEVNFKNVIKNKKTIYTKESEINNCEQEVTYIDSTKMPIYQSGKIKYIFVTTSEVTKRELEIKNLEKQNEELVKHSVQLGKHNAQLVDIIENLSEGVMFADNKGQFMMVNAEAKRLVYQSDIGINLKDSLKNTKVFDMLGNEVSYENFPSVRALRGERSNNIKIFVRNPNKEYFAEISSIPVYDASGDVTMIVSCFHDITQTIYQSRKIEEQKKELEAIIENISDSIAIFDDKKQFILINKTSREMFFSSYNNMDNISEGYKQSDFYDINGGQIEPEDSPSSRVMRGEEFKNMRVLVKSPYKTLQVDVSGTPIYDSDGKFSLGVLCSKDMTEYFKHEEATKSRYEFLNRMVNTFDLPVVRLSCPNLLVVDINKKAFNIIKLFRPNVESIKQIKNNKIEELFESSNTSDYYKCINEVIKEKKTKYLNKKKYNLNGNEIYWNLIFEPLLSPNDEIEEILILIIDVTA